MARAAEALMAKMMADGLERDHFGKQMAGTGMAQRMGTAMGCLDIYTVKLAAGKSIESASREGTKGCIDGREHFSAAAARAHILKITNNGAAHFMGQWIDLGTMLLSAPDRELLQCSVDVLKP